MAQSHRARPLILNSTFGIKSQFSAKKIFTFRLTGQETGVYIPGRDISEMPEEYRKGGNARFFTWDLNSFEAPAAGMVCLAAAALAAVAAAGPAAPQSNSETPHLNY